MKKLILAPMTALIFSVFSNLAFAADVIVPPKTEWETAKEQPYYMEENTERYMTFKEKNADLSFEQVISFVNSGVDLPHYTQIRIIAEPSALLTLCNKNNRLPSDYVPNLAAYKGKQMEINALKAYQNMESALLSTGYALGLRSAYRSYDYQSSLYASYVRSNGQTVTDTYSARPGHSEHQLGLAVDITQPNVGGSLSSARFENTAQYAWLQEHAQEYGFILRYPKDKTQITGYVYEPWHYRYVGVDAATAIWEKGITFEEYYGKYVAWEIWE